MIDIIRCLKVRNHFTVKLSRNSELTTVQWDQTLLPTQQGVSFEYGDLLVLLPGNGTLHIRPTGEVRWLTPLLPADEHRLTRHGYFSALS